VTRDIQEIPLTCERASFTLSEGQSRAIARGTYGFHSPFVFSDPLRVPLLCLSRLRAGGQGQLHLVSLTVEAAILGGHVFRNALAGLESARSGLL